LDIFQERPDGFREKVAVLRNDEQKENLVIQYEYDTRTLSTAAKISIFSNGSYCVIRYSLPIVQSLLYK
jgi:hypothetical protein